MRFFLHPAAVGLALALVSVALVRIIAHEPAPPAHLTAHVLEFGVLYLIGMTGAALVIAWQSQPSRRRWLRPLFVYFAVGLAASAATALMAVSEGGTPLETVGEVAVGWSVLLVVAAVGLWVLPYLAQLERRQQVPRGLAERPSTPAGLDPGGFRAPHAPSITVPATEEEHGAVDQEGEMKALGFLITGAWLVASLVMLALDGGDGSGPSVLLIGLLAAGWLLSPFLAFVAVGVSTGVRALSRGRAGGAGEGIVMMLAVALPVVGVVALTVLAQSTGQSP